MNETENLSIKEAAYQFIDALSKITKLNKEQEIAKIVLCGKENQNETITYKRNLEKLDEFDFLDINKNDEDEFITILKDDDTVYNCRRLYYDKEKEIHISLMKPETVLKS